MRLHTHTLEMVKAWNMATHTHTHTHARNGECLRIRLHTHTLEMVKTWE